MPHIGYRNTCTITTLEILSVLCCHVPRDVDVVVHVAKQVITQPWSGSAQVSDELSFGHLVLDVGAGQVHTQQDEGVANNINGVWGTRKGSLHTPRTLD